MTKRPRSRDRGLLVLARDLYITHRILRYSLFCSVRYGNYALDRLLGTLPSQ